MSERDAFEKWVKKHWDLDREQMPSLCGVANQWDGKWSYTYANTSGLWSCWRQARAQTPSTSRAADVEELLLGYQKIVRNEGFGGNEELLDRISRAIAAMGQEAKPENVGEVNDMIPPLPEAKQPALSEEEAVEIMVKSICPKGTHHQLVGRAKYEMRIAYRALTAIHSEHLKKE